MPKVVLLCGLTCSGKSSYARQLAEQGYLWLSVDADVWQAGCKEQPVPAELQRAIKVAHKKQLLAAVADGRDVVLDYALANRARREEYRQLAIRAGAEVELVFFDLAADELRRRLALRNAGPRGPHSVFVEMSQLEKWIANFDPPAQGEYDLRLGAEQMVEAGEPRIP